MTMTWEQVVDATDAEMVGGTLQLRMGNANVVLGQKTGAAFNYTQEGEDLVRQLEANPRKRKKADPEPKDIQLTLQDELEGSVDNLA
jgi:hypothetical protein